MYKQLFFKFVERVGTHIVSFIINIILARLLIPEDYGIMAVINALIALSQILLQGGFNTALVQKNDSNDDDYFSIMLISLAISIVLCLLINLVAPIMGQIYNNVKLVAPLKTLALVLIIQAITSVYTARVVSSMKFKVLMKATLFSSALSGIICIGLAYSGIGIWALVIQQLLNAFLLLLVLMVQTKWVPKGKFVSKSAKRLFSFGWKVMLTNLISRGYAEFSSLVIGKVFSSTTLAFYNRGKQFPQMISDNIDGTLQGVSLPVFSKQSSSEQVVGKLREFINIATFILYPLLCLLAIIGEDLVVVLLTDKWVECAPFLVLWCLYYIMVSHTTLCNEALLGSGKSSVTLKRQILNTSVLVITMIVSIIIWEDAFLMLLCLVCARIFNMFVTMILTNKELKYSYKTQIQDLSINIPATIVAVITTIVVGMLFEKMKWISIVVRSIVMMVVYILVSMKSNKVVIRKAKDLLIKK